MKLMVYLAAPHLVRHRRRSRAPKETRSSMHELAAAGCQQGQVKGDERSPPGRCIDAKRSRGSDSRHPLHADCQNSMRLLERSTTADLGEDLLYDRHVAALLRSHLGLAIDEVATRGVSEGGVSSQGHTAHGSSDGSGKYGCRHLLGNETAPPNLVLKPHLTSPRFPQFVVTPAPFRRRASA